jgi:hypothetical protein
MNTRHFPHPELCIDGLPSRAYTESACLAALLLLVDRQRRIEQQLGVQLAKPINTYYPESLLDVMENTLFHHSHNSKVVKILVECEIKSIILMTCPGLAFANIYYCGIREDVKVAKYINFYRDWLAILPSCEKPPIPLFSKPSSWVVIRQLSPKHSRDWTCSVTASQRKR